MADRSGRVIASRYLIVRRLGGGGMGTVWEAVDEALHVTVAIKEINIKGHSDAVRRELVARAMREARSAAKLRGHPHVVTVYDVVEDQGLPWIVMELVKGRSLEDVIREDGPLDSARAAVIGIAVLDALSFADGLGIVHRDVKPANILLTESGEVKLTDFGIAAAQDATRITADGQTPMTVAYTAPERIRNEPATAVSDIFSLGVTLYEAVEGKSPFQRKGTPATIYAVLDDDPPPPRHAPRLAETLRLMLVKDPLVRASASRVRADLAKVSRRARPLDAGFRHAVEQLFHADGIEDRVAAVQTLVEMPGREDLVAAVLSIFIRANPVGGRDLIPRPLPSWHEIVEGERGIAVDSQKFDQSTSDVKTALFAIERLAGAPVYLSGVDLFGMLLPGVNLAGADLRGADLRGAVLDQAQLRDCSLARTNLCDVSIRSADLSRANLNGADLVGVKISGDTVLSGADLTNAWLGITTFERHHPNFLEETTGKPGNLHGDDGRVIRPWELFLDALNFDRARHEGPHGEYMLPWRDVGGVKWFGSKGPVL